MCPLAVHSLAICLVGDISGNARIQVQLTHELSLLTSAVDVAVGADCDNTDAATTLKYPCEKWKWTPTWVALQKAYDMLYPAGDSRASVNKVVLVVTGATYVESVPHMCVAPGEGSVCADDLREEFTL